MVPFQTPKPQKERDSNNVLKLLNLIKKIIKQSNKTTDLDVHVHWEVKPQSQNQTQGILQRIKQWHSEKREGAPGGLGE